MELVKVLLPIVVPVAIGIASAVFGHLFLTSRRLRSELLVDSEMLDRLPDDARQELSEEVRLRTYLLVAYARYPALTRPEIMALLAMLVITVAGVALVWDEKRVGGEPTQNPLIVSGLLVALTVGFWVSYLDSWVARAVDRVAYIQQRPGGKQAMEQAVESARVLRAAVWLTMLGGLACVLTIPVYLLFVTEVYELGDLARGWAVVGVVALALAFVGLTVWRSQPLIQGSIAELQLRLYAREHARPIHLDPDPDSDRDSDLDPHSDQHST
jgi:hypothetical protein